jgi:hypothetical protein
MGSLERDISQILHDLYRAMPQQPNGQVPIEELILWRQEVSTVSFVLTS